MEEVQYHHHHHHSHHHHHHHDSKTGAQGEIQPVGNVLAAQQNIQGQLQRQQVIQPNLATPVSMEHSTSNQSFGSAPTIGVTRSVPSYDSTSEMARYFPRDQSDGSLPLSHSQEAHNQTQSTATTTSVETTTTTAVNVGPFISPAPIRPAVPNFQPPIRPQHMEQQPIRPPGPPPPPSGIPSYSTQIQGLSVSQTAVNDILVDLQKKVLDETANQFYGDVSNDTHIEPIAPIYIQAPQPTLVLQSDLNRLRAELNSRVRPPVIYRHPAGANQFQQHQQQQQQFQQNVFQGPRFPVPPATHIPPECYGGYPYSTAMSR